VSSRTRGARRRAVPGPNAKRLVRRDSTYISSSYTRAYDFAVERGRGVWLWDVDHNKFLDFTSGIAVCATGHSHPRVVAAIKKQAEKFLHMSGSDFYYRVEVDLAEALSRITPGKFRKRSFFCNSGAEAVEAAIKLARYSTGRSGMIAFVGAFHGRTMGALSLTASKAVQREKFLPLVPQVVHVPYADCRRCVFNLSYPSCELACVKYIEEVVFAKLMSPRDVAAIFVEPIQGEGGYVVPPPKYLPRLARLAKKHRILLVADEVQSGMGRTGKMFASEHWGVVPDIVTVAKGIASGLPLGVCVARADLMTWAPGSHGSTFGGNPVSCAAALETIKLLEGGLVENARKMGELLAAHLEELVSRFDFLGWVSGKGLMTGLEIVRDKEKYQGDPDMRNLIVQKCFKKGLLVLGCGPSAVRFSPPLVVKKSEIERAVGILEEVAESISRRGR